MLHIGIIPQKLKIALVTPIFRANESNKFKNYRPISVLTCFSKLLEKFMYKRLIKFIDLIKTPIQIQKKSIHGICYNRDG